MGRPGKPWWYSKKERWAATVAGVRHLAPPDIGRKDQHAAWAWHARVSGGVRAVPVDTVKALCEKYLEWDEGRVAAGARDRRGYTNAVSALQKVCDTVVANGKFGALRLAVVKPDHLGALLAAWSREGLSPGYRRTLAGRMRAAFRWASMRVEGRPAIMDASPFAGVPIPPAPRAEDRYATRAEAATWLRWLWRRGLREYAFLQRCLIHTGARPSELTRAAWSDISWNGDRPAVLVRTQWKSARSTGKARRVYIPRRLHRRLRRRRPAAAADRVFLNDSGRPWNGCRLASYTAGLRGLAVAAGVGIRDKGPERMTCYRWRHTAASTLLMSGVPLPTVAELLGTSPKMIASTYGHILDDHLADAAEGLARRRF